MQLKETVEIMISDDCKDRLKAEYKQTLIRYLDLNKMLLQWKIGKLAFEPECPRVLYEMQLESMKAYLDILVVRAAFENVNIEQEVGEKRLLRIKNELPNLL